ncbi:hypothetical protein [Taklimakanibacter deserti]|uniref:hypothetical protein n=1 Tax=Taklimakanibacter deserti TaxID=2267839 RepID=UPI000E651DCB
MSHHAPINESIRIWVTARVPAETKSALAAFCRRNGYPHLYFEVLEPLLAQGNLIFSLATSERPWPPKGIGSQAIDAVAVAMVASEGRAHLTPVLMDRKHVTNVGLAGAVTKQLLEALRDRKASSAGYLIRQSERALERVLEQSGFARADLQSATEYAEYLEHSAPPQKILEALGLAKARIGDLLALNLNDRELDRLSSYHFALAVGIAPYLWDSIRNAAILPGLIDLIAAAPPGGVPPGTAGPSIGEPGAIRR